MKYKVRDVVDLDDVLISPRAHASWHAAAAVGAQALPAVHPSLIPDEQGIWLPTGELEIFVEIAGHRISMKIPPSEWAWKQ